ncbi:uncharacterized protein RJT20DRAFT_48159 [Scheffersomyces xylosifermentans]|uniref:uncharacterized protein n=1 Tax=Scheffersomyces xylosifermentans TaxID=1304137 RepID=UPI00315C7E5C
MSRVQLLTVGTNPNVAFYSWRFFETKTVDVTCVNASLNINGSISWQSPSFGNNIQYRPQHAYKAVTDIPKTSEFDIVTLSCSSLQEFQKVCTDIAPYLQDDAVILVESTGYVNLEPFIHLSLSKKSNLCILSIMNESDIRQVDTNKYHHTIRNKDTRIYLGTSSGSNRISGNANFQRVYKLLQTVQSDSRNQISLLKSLNPKEFMTYQWKLALPRILFNPLSVIFEFEFPEQLDNQILCKPLVTGIINELFKIIKKMDCKLVKGFENEANLGANWASYYPKTSNNKTFMNSNQFFYNFYNKYDLDVDLLLLQPILLADDNGIRTPYLENLYSTMCQYSKINSDDSIFFSRKGEHSAKNGLTSNGYLDQDISKKLAQKNKLDESIREIEARKAQLDTDVTNNQTTLKSLTSQVAEIEASLRNLQTVHAQRSREMDLELDQKRKELDYKHQQQQSNYQQSIQQQKQQHQQQLQQLQQQQDQQKEHLKELKAQQEQQAQMVQKQQLQQQPQPYDNHLSRDRNGSGDQRQPNNRESIQADLDDLTDIALYGAALNGEYVDQGQDVKLVNGDLPQQQPQMYVDTHQPQQKQPYYPQQQQQQFNQYNNGPQYVPNGYQQSPLDQQPPHGLPPHGLPQNGLPPNLRANSNASMRYQQPNGYYNQHQPPRRVSSIPNSVNSYFDGGYQQSQPMYPQQHSHNSFNNAAPIDPMLEQRFKAPPKKQNRRSAFPMSGNLDGLDMGGRGGMPMPGQPPKHRSMGPGQYPTMQSPARKSVSHMNGLNGQMNNLNVNNTGGSMPQSQSQSSQYLQPPLLNGSASSNSSTNTNDTPKTSSSSNENDKVSIPVPAVDAGLKPLGNIASSNKAGSDKKKKKGMFSKKG